MSRSVLASCTAQQKESATELDRPVLVLSGAGTGKTYAAAMRCAYLIQDLGVMPSNILVMVGSQRLVAELNQRLERLMQAKAPSAWVHTYETFCCQILRDRNLPEGYTREFVVYDEADRHGLIRSILKEFNIHEALFKGIASRISALKAGMTDAEAFVAGGGGFGFEEKLAQVYMRYQSDLRRHNALDHDDLIMLVVRLMQEDPAFLKSVSSRARHLVVDDFQDATAAQYALVRLLARSAESVFIAADEDQAIVGARGGTGEQLAGLTKDFKRARSIRFGSSHRCTAGILAAAGSIIRGATKCSGRALTSQKKDGPRPEWFHAVTENDEATHIARGIRELYLTGQYEYGDFAILYRMSAQLKPIEESLRAESIPYMVSSAYPLFQRPEVRDAIAYARLALNPRDALSLRRVLLAPPWSLSEAALSKFMAAARSETQDVLDHLKKAVKTRKTMSRFKTLLEALHNAQPGRRNAGEMIDHIISRAGYRDALALDAEGEAKRQGLDRLIERARGWDLCEFLDHVALSYEDETPRAGDVVLIANLNETQGLEFPVVFITGLEEGILPHSHACKEDGPALDEERRLLYVGMTRARDQLYLSCSSQRRLYSRTQDQVASRFLRDLPEECCIRIRRHPLEKKEAPAPVQSRRTLGINMPYPIGARVKHIRWGAGIVRDYVGQGEEAKVTVNFPGHGVKRLAVKFANLEVV